MATWNGEAAERNLNFSDRKTEYHEFPTSWKTERLTEEGTCQTDEVKAKESASQVTMQNDAETQADLVTAPQSRMGVTVDEASLAAFLRRVTPGILEELSADEGDYHHLDEDDEHDSQIEKPKVLYELRSNAIPDDVPVSSVSWSCGGYWVASSYCVSEHISWCNHEGLVLLWEPGSRKFNPTQHCSMIHAKDCVTCIQFHPTKATYLAIGTFNGTVEVQDVGEGSDLVARTNDNRGARHAEAVTGVTWSTKASNRDASLCTCSRDGRVFIWQIDQRNKSLEPLKWFEIKMEKLPYRLRPQGYMESNLGLTCMSFNSEDETLFIVGTDKGGVVQCSQASVLPLPTPEGKEPEGKEAISPCSPVSYLYEPHVGAVLQVRYSPFIRDAFVSCSSDGEVRLFNMLQPMEPARRMYLENHGCDVQWSPVKPLLFVIGDSKGALNFCDLKNTPTQSLTVVQPESTRKMPITAMSFDLSNHLAVGDAAGRLRVWTLPHTMTTKDTHEMTTLLRYMEAEGL